MRLLLVSAALALAPAPAMAQSLDSAINTLANNGFRGQVLAGNATDVLLDRTVGIPAQKIWIWGSVSKQVTAVAAARLAQQGHLSLDDTLASRLPAFAGHPRAGVATRQLFNHTSGLANPSDGAVGDAIPPFYMRKSRQAGTSADATGFCAGPPAGEQGSYRYNNCDTIVAAAMMEQAAGRPFTDILRREVFRPAGMGATRLAKPMERFAFSASGGRVNVATYGAAGALVGPARDLVKFDQALMNGKLLNDRSLSIIWQGDPAIGYVALGAWGFSAPLKGCAGEVRLVERRGDVEGVQVRNLIAPDLKRVLVVFTPDQAFDFGEIWQGSGASYDLASAAFCAG